MLVDIFAVELCAMKILSFLIKLKQKEKSFPSHVALDGAHLRYSSPQQDNSLHRETTDTGLVHCVVCLFTPQPLGHYQFTACDRGT